MECELEPSTPRRTFPVPVVLNPEDPAWIGTGAEMEAILRLVDRAAGIEAPVLVVGERGTGTELIARRLHRNGPRREKSFITANCAAIPELLLESELFGHQRAAFPGAQRDRIGLCIRAEGGSLLLDEIGEAPLHVQTKLLRALREREIWPLGGAGPRRIDVRLICTTSRDLASQVKEGRFLADLCCRINVIRIELPPLRERPRDLPEMCRRYLEPLGQSLDPAAQDRVLRYPWPGNVRELFQVLHRAASLCRGPLIGPHLLDLPDPPTEPGGPLEPLDHYLDRATRTYLLEVLRRSGWNRRRAASILRVDRTTVYRLMKKYGIES